MRHEVKHSINALDDLVLTARLKALFEHDRHAGSHGSYRVSSLYFDTPYDKAVADKLSGADVREKFRLRYYGENTAWLRLECKQKVGQMTAKKSIRLTKTEAKRLMSGDLDVLFAPKDPLRMFFYSRCQSNLLRPVVQVTYDREAFHYLPGNVRITIDRNLRTNPGGCGFLNPDTPHLDAADGLAVLEVKYDAFLPDLVRLAVQIPDRRSAAISKYVISRRYD